MSNSNKHTTLSKITLIFCALFASAVAFGSGGGGGGGGGGNDHTSLIVSEKTYELGKKVFYENVVCDTCIHAGLELTPESVRASWKKIKKDLRKSGKIGANLGSKERKSVKLFMRKRFKL